ncbi:hypothetical protein BTN92_08545 [Enterococcus mundtii]|uniref:EamA domain-containing protein n=1 Tax=Enterococcus mundtii TaxID=53346 RepID=A0A1V2UIB0_ENTMU|nr:hypothetical protein BTN92_08545 [Enterococcus mundtii]
MKSIGILSILIGVYINDARFIHLFAPHFSRIVIFILGLIGIAFAFTSWKISNLKGDRYLAINGLLLNGVPMLSYLYLHVII